MLTDTIDRLKMREMSVDGLTAAWCPQCFRVLVFDSKAVKGLGRGTTVISEGSDTCGYPIIDGTIRECIQALSAISKNSK